MSDDTSLAADLSAAMSDTSTQSSGEPSGATVEASAQPGAATTEPAASTTEIPSTEQVPKPSRVGPFSTEEHQRILENARTKARDEALSEWRQQHGWAEQVQRDQFEAMASWYQRAHADPVTFAQELINELSAHPTHGHSLRSMAARALAQGRGQSQAVELPQPDVEITDAQGQVVGRTYSDKQLQIRDTWLTQQVLAQVHQQLAPRLQAVDAMTQERSELAADKFSRDAFEEGGKLPGFIEHKAEIGKVLANMKLPSDDPEIVRLALQAAYARVVPSKLHTTERKAVLNDIHAKAQVNTVSPTAPSAGTPKTYADMTWQEAFEHELAARR